jgi:hypothetical protein
VVAFIIREGWDSGESHPLTYTKPMNKETREALGMLLSLIISGLLKIPYIRVAQLVAIVLGIFELKGLKNELPESIEPEIQYPELPPIPGEKPSLFKFKK